MNAVRHYGYDAAPTTLLRSRWRSRYFDGYGQLLRCNWSKPYFGETLRVCQLYLLVIGWWGAVAGLIAAIALGIAEPALLVAVMALPPVAASIRKHSVSRGMYTVLLWQFHAAALLRGLLRPQMDPSIPVEYVIIALTALGRAAQGSAGLMGCRGCLDHARRPGVIADQVGETPAHRNELLRY